MRRLAVFLFGPPRIELNGKPVKLSRHKALALFVYLITTQQRSSRNTLATLLWPNHDQSRARAALRRVLVDLNEAGLGPWLRTERETIELATDEALWSDVGRFHDCLSQCLAAQSDPDQICIPLLTEASHLYEDDFLSGFSLRDSAIFDEWQLFQTEKLRRDLGSALARLVRSHSSNGNIETALTFAHRWFNLDPFYEPAQRWLMQLYAWNNQRAAAVRQYQDWVQLLAQELGVEPSAETKDLYARIQHGEGPSPNPRQASVLPARPLEPAAAALYNFPTQPTPFVGRETELQEIAQTIQKPDCRLLTLTGSGGIGKTRLAIQVATTYGHIFRDGVYYVALAPVSSPEFLIATIVDHLKVTLDGQSDPQLQLVNHLRSQVLLLVLDNFEHLIRKANLLADLLLNAPQFKILVTSQERLNLQDEWVYEVQGMQYPDTPKTDGFEHYSAVALFLQRARRVNASFILAETDRPCLVRICQLLDGNPLAIELAATWTRLLTCQEIVKEIDRIYRYQDNLDFLTTSLRDIPERHRTMRRVFEHSWRLLTPQEQDLVKRLAVFQGGSQRDAIEQVTGAKLNLISALVDKSLLSRNSSGRYEAHQLLRQYSREKLQKTPEKAQETFDKHCFYYIAFLQQREADLRGHNQKETLSEVAREIENIRAAWRWAIAHGHLQAIAQGMDSLWHFYASYGWFQEGLEMFGRALEIVPRAEAEQADRNTQATLGQLMAYLSWFFLRQGLYEQAEDLLTQSITTLENLNDPYLLAMPLNFLGVVKAEVGMSEQAQDLLQRSIDIYRGYEDNWRLAWTLSYLAYSLSALPDYRSEANRLLQESLTLYQTIGNKQGLGFVLNTLGYLAYQAGELNQAQQLLVESLALRREVGFPRGIAVSLANLGHVTAALGEYHTSQLYYRDSLRLATAINALPLTLSALTGLAACQIATKRDHRATELLTLVLHHPASNQETCKRARRLLAELNLASPTDSQGLPFGSNSSLTSEMNEQFEAIVAELLAET